MSLSYSTYTDGGGDALVACAEYRPDGGGPAERHIMATPCGGGTFARQWAAVRDAALRACGPAEPVMMRVFLSDPANQSAGLTGLPGCAVSTVGQPPVGVPGAKVAVWLMAREDASVTAAGPGIYVAALPGGAAEIWMAGMSRPGCDSRAATISMLTDCDRALAARGSSLAGGVLRTWFFVHDIDTNYAGMVKGRNEVFDSVGLTADTHFIASTGIGGSDADPAVTVLLDVYAATGTAPDAVKYLHAPDRLNPTAEYGVAFERGTAVTFADRRRVLISGTASIDSRGRIVHAGDVEAQTRRMCDNVEALLADAGCSAADMMHAIVYIRDVADAAAVGAMIAGRYPGLPCVVTLAPVCRPGWLVEMECMAMCPPRE